MATTRSQSQAQAQSMSTSQGAEATHESDSPQSTSSQASIGNTHRNETIRALNTLKVPYHQDGYILLPLSLAIR